MTIVINGSTGITSVDGTAVAPTLTGTDTDTGVFQPAANTIALATNGTEQVRVDSIGNVGVGTTAPSANAKISVNGAVQSQSTVYPAFQLYNSGVVSGDPYFRIAYDVNKNLVFNSVNAGYTGSTERIRMDASGKVGIGTASPGVQLDVAGGILAAQGTPGGSGVNNVGYSFRGDGDTGMYSTGDGVLGLWINNAQTLGFSLGTINLYNQSASSFPFDVTTSTVTFANGGFWDMASFSGILMITNHVTGASCVYLCGGGVVTFISTTGAANIAASYNAGINGYTIQNQSGSTVTYGVIKFRTRQGA